MVMGVLEDPSRFNEIKWRLEGVTQRVLTQTLRRLERNGMVVRTVLPTSPVGVEYSLTPLGHSLREPFSHLHAWTVEHAAEIQEHQTEYNNPLRRRCVRPGAGVVLGADGGMEVCLFTRCRLGGVGYRARGRCAVGAQHKNRCGEPAARWLNELAGSTS